MGKVFRKEVHPLSHRISALKMVFVTQPLILQKRKLRPGEVKALAQSHLCPVLAVFLDRVYTD